MLLKFTDLLTRAWFSVMFLAHGCTTIGHEPAPSDWPALDVRVHSLPHKEMRDRCLRFAPPGYDVEACAEINFAKGSCDIVLSADFLRSGVLEHEREHCSGKDHVGASTLRDAWARFKGAR